MELVLRKRSTGETLRLHSAKVLCHHSRKLAFLAPYTGQWLLYALAAPASARLLYNHQPAPPHCPLAAGDLLNLNGLEWIVDAVVVDSNSVSVAETGEPPSCEIEMAGGRRIRVCHDLVLGLDLPPQSALLTFAAGRWHLHDLNGSTLFCNGKAASRSVVLSNGDCIRIAETHFRFHSGGAAGLENLASGAKEPENRKAQTENSTPEIDPVYAQAKELFERLLPALRDPGRQFRPRQASGGGLRGWLRIFRRPRTPLDTLARLRFLLSACPRDRVWLIELARFFFLQSYPGLCLRLLKELCRLYPRDVRVRQTLAKFYYQQGRNSLLPVQGRLSAFDHAGSCTQLARRLAPNDSFLLDLERAIRMDLTILSYRLDEMKPSETPSLEGAEAIGRMR